MESFEKNWGADQTPTDPDNEQERNKFEKENEIRAEARNNSASLIKKKVLIPLGLGSEVKAIDIAHEEALKANAAVDKKTEQKGISPQEASNNILKSHEFGHKNEDRIKFEEFLKAKAPKVIKFLEEGNIDEAFFATPMTKEWEELPNTGASFDAMVAEKIDALIESNDIEAMKKMVSINLPSRLGLENIKRMPQEVLESRDVQKVVIEKIKTEFGNGSIYDTHSIKHWLDTYLEAGMMTKDHVKNLFETEEMQKKMENAIKFELSDGTRIGGPQLGVRNAKFLIDRYLEVGMMNEAKANEYLKELGIRLE